MMALLGKTYRMKCHASVKLPHLHRDLTCLTASLPPFCMNLNTAHVLGEIRKLRNTAVLQLNSLDKSRKWNTLL